MNHGKTSRQSSWGETLESDAERTRTAALRLSQNSKQKQRYQVILCWAFPWCAYRQRNTMLIILAAVVAQKGAFLHQSHRLKGTEEIAYIFFLLLCLYADRCTCVCVCISEYVEAGSQIRVVLWRTPLHRH